MQNYAVQELEKIRITLEKALEGWNPEHYPEAFRDRNKKLKDINKALEILKQNNEI